jgi:RNA polymerase-interacting CarD/CdnL/TRCF family regulator
MKYQVHDRVMHWTYGTGEIVSIEKKTLSGDTREYYVFRTSDLTLWVPADESGENNLRPPLSSDLFRKQLKSLTKPAESLPDQPYPRQNELMERMRNRSLADICSVIRDLTARESKGKLNRSDQDIMNRAQSLLVDEWQLSLGGERHEIERELYKILHKE